ncbi:MAG: protein kinase [Chloroflexi bacterium]|nr:protein kinase [Chloroflexota bacterium]MDE0181728.1 protein kinase [Caldilineaceae bacterium]
MRPKRNSTWKPTGQTLGSGGQGQVRLVTLDAPGSDGTQFAQKILRNSQSDQARTRFKQEIEALMELIDEPGIINVYDFSIEGEKKHYYVMDYHEGAKSLDKIIFSKSNPFHGNTLGSLGLFERIVQAIEVCSTNSRPIFHRDINPKNILFLEDGSIRLIDFGVCQFEDGQIITLYGEAVGARNYASPECEVGDVAGAYSDLYSAAKVLWSAITSRPAFPREDRVFNDMSMQKVFPEIPETWHLSHIFERTIRKDVQYRCQSASHVSFLITNIRRIIEGGFPPVEQTIDHCPSCGWSGGIIGNYSDPYQRFGVSDNRKPPVLHCTMCGFVFVRDYAVLNTFISNRMGFS